MRRKMVNLLVGILVGVLLMGCGKTENPGETITVVEKEKKPEKGMKTIYVQTNQETIYTLENPGTYLVSYTLDKNGVISRKNTFMTYEMDGQMKESKDEIAYVIDYENIMQYMDAGMEKDEEIAGKYRSFIDKQENISEDIIFYVLSVNSNQKICRNVIASIGNSWEDICEEGSHFDYSYNEAGKRVEYISFNKGRIWSLTTSEYNDENKLILQKSHDYITNRETTIEVMYDSEKRVDSTNILLIDLDSGTKVRNSTENKYNEAGKLEKSISNGTEISIYKYDEDGKLKKISNFNSDGLLSSETVYTYEEVKVPAESIDFLCHLYDHVGLAYEILE